LQQMGEGVITSFVSIGSHSARTLCPADHDGDGWWRSPVVSAITPLLARQIVV